MGLKKKAPKTRKISVAAAAIFLVLAAAGCSARPRETTGRIPLDLKQFRAEFNSITEAKHAAAVAIEPSSGRVFAIANPQAVSFFAYPVGSAFKPVSVVAAVEEGIAGPGFPAHCEGKALIRGQELKCWLREGHGRLAMPDAIARSCNIFFYTLGTRFKGPELLRWAADFGFGKRPGFITGDRAGLEAAGALPDVFTPEKVPLYAAGDTTEILASPMQMAVFVSALANGGRVVKPHYGQKKTVVIKQLNAEKGIAAAVEGMRRCVSDPEGTCRALQTVWPDAAGKTGTGLRLTGPGTHAWFMGFSPVDKPEIAVVVFINRGRGETDAAPAARDIFQAYYRCKAKQP